MDKYSYQLQLFDSCWISLKRKIRGSKFRTAEAKTGPTPDWFTQKGPDPDQCPEIRTFWGGTAHIIINTT